MFEVIVVDDGSNDNSNQVIEEFIGSLDIRYFSRVRSGFGVSAARNIGIREARARLCVLVDAGLLMNPSFLEAHLAAHNASSGPTAVIGYVYCFDHENEHELYKASIAIESDDVEAIIKDFSRTRRWPDYRDRLVYRKLGDTLEEYPAPWAIFFCCNVSASTEQLRAVGGFDEMYQSWGTEDVDLGYRLFRNGSRFVLSRDAAAIHIPHAPNLQANRFSLLCNSHYMAIKYRTPITSLLPHVHTPHINEVVLRNRIVHCHDYVRQISRPPLLGIRADFPDPEHRRLLQEIVALDPGRSRSESAPLLFDLDRWAQLRQKYIPEWNDIDYAIAARWSTGFANVTSHH